MREKITHFDHERIPERIVHARGSGAHGYFEAFGNVGDYTKAAFLNDTAVKTPVFVRFSTVAGFRGSTDMARDVRGFAIKFYTQEGNFDMVGNNIPVFFIQDAMKFLARDITLTTLAVYLETNNRYTSDIILYYRGKKFADYVNGLKVDYIIDLLKTDKHKRMYTHDALAEEAGFSSTQRFVQAFKLKTGISPKFFSEKIREEMTEV